MAYAENILTLAYDFLKYLILVLSKYPRDQKFMLADRIQNLAHDILDDFITAYYSWAGSEKLERLRKTNIKLERLRYSIRLSQVLKLFTNHPEGVKYISPRATPWEKRTNRAAIAPNGAQ